MREGGKIIEDRGGWEVETSDKDKMIKKYDGGLGRYEDDFETG